MAAWQDNAIMYWNGNKITDHGRSPLDITWERIGSDNRTINGTLRRFHVAKKRSISVSWENIPSKTAAGGIQTVDGGYNGSQIESFFNSTDGAFTVVLRNGSAQSTVAPATVPFSDANFDIFRAMITDYSRTVNKRGVKTDLWNIDITLVEV